MHSLSHKWHQPAHLSFQHISVLTPFSTVHTYDYSTLTMETIHSSKMYQHTRTHRTLHQLQTIKYIQSNSSQCSLRYRLFVASYNYVLNYMWILDKQNREDKSRLVSFSYRGHRAMFMKSKQIVRFLSHTTTFLYSGMMSDGTITIFLSV